jgi:hypothetical protein
VLVLDGGGYVGWMLRLVAIGAEEDDRAIDVMEIHRPNGLGSMQTYGVCSGYGRSWAHGARVSWWRKWCGGSSW